MEGERNLRVFKRFWRGGGASEAGRLSWFAVVDRLRQLVTWNLGLGTWNLGGNGRSRSGPFLPFGTGRMLVVSKDLHLILATAWIASQCSHYYCTVQYYCIWLRERKL
jgi:hypothetical protein